MKKKEKFLDLHERLLRDGLTYKEAVYGGGLCNVLFNGENLDQQDDFRLFIPHNLIASYWGYDGTTEQGYLVGLHPRRYEYTPLRQNIILFLAALNNEL